MTSPTALRVPPRRAVLAVIDALAAEGMEVTVMTYALDSLRVVTRPHATWDTACRVFAALDAPPLSLTRLNPEQGSIRAAGPVPALGLHLLSLAIDIERTTTP